MTEAQFRNKVIWFSFAFSLLVVWAHSYNAELFLGYTGEMQIVYRAEYLFGERLGQIAVPGFFMISGYLFYRDFTWEKLWGKWNRRIRSLLVPYILWNGIYYLGYVIGSRLPWVTEVVGKGTVPLSLPALVDALLHYRYNYVFWYLQQLIVLTVLAPVLYRLLRRRWSAALLGVVLTWLAVKDVYLPGVNLDALIYYGTAAFLALETNCQREKGNMLQSRFLPESSWNWKGALLGAGLSVLAAVSYYLGLSHGAPAGFLFCRLMAVAGLWLLVPGERLPEAKGFMKQNFFLYATHFAVVRFINKAMNHLFWVTMWEPFLLFLVMPALALGGSTLLARGLRKIWPAAWDLLNGYRM